MKESARSILTFYQSFAPFTLLISIGSWVLTEAPLGRDLMRFIPLYFFMKVFTDALIWYYIKIFAAKRLFFYFNLGISGRQLFLSAFGLDFTLFLVLLVSLNFILNALQ